MIDVQSILSQTYSTLVNITPEQWGSLGQLVITSGVLTPVISALHKATKVQRDWLKFFSAVIVCAIAAFVLIIKDIISIDPLALLSILSVLTMALYYGVYKPSGKKWLPKAAEALIEARLYKQYKTSRIRTEEVPGRVI